MNQKLLLQLNQDLQKQPDPFCNLEEVAELYHLTCLLDENIPNIEVPDGATPIDIEELLSGYLKDRNIERCDSLQEVTLYPNLELECADLEPLEYIENQTAFNLLTLLVSLYSSKSISTIDFTGHVLDYREDWFEEDEDDPEYSQAIMNSANEILKTRTALAIIGYWGTPIIDQICSLRKELSLHKKEIPAFLEKYISDALATFEKCTSKRFTKLAGDDDYDNEGHSPLYYNTFFLYPENPENIYSHDLLIDDIDEMINCDLQNCSGEITVSQENYGDISFFLDAVNEYKEVVANFKQITEAL